MFDGMEKWKEDVRVFLQDQKVRKSLVGILILSVLLMGLMLGKERGQDGKYQLGEQGNIVGITGNDGKGAQSFPLRLQIPQKGKTLTKDVVVTLRDKKKKTPAAPKESKDAKLQQEIDRMLRKIESTEKKEVILPRKLGDGTVVTWKKPKRQMPLILLVPVLMVMGVAYSYRKKRRDAVVRRRESVGHGIPAFTDQILLLLSCGLIFPDAFARVVDGYRQREEDFFRGEMIHCQDIAQQNHRNVVTVLRERSEQYRIPSLTRVVGYIVDHQHRGVDLCEHLETCGRELWEERKKNAEERGKIAETKLTVPLAILLVVLILITAAPALLQVEGV